MFTVEKNINFNGCEIPTKGKVIRRDDKHYLVDFSFNHVEYRGWWPISHCKVIFG